MAKRYFVEHEIAHREVDVSKDRAGLRQMVTMTGQHGVPVILVGEKTLVGWNASEFERLRRGGGRR